jgi:hypothetical protein
MVATPNRWRIENCQIGTFLSYATAKGHVFLDRRLYLPAEWCSDAERRAQAKVPADVVFQTKPEQAMAMLILAGRRADALGDRGRNLRRSHCAARPGGGQRALVCADSTDGL